MTISAAGLPDETRGMLLGLTGVLIFSLTLPCTRLAVRELDPAFVALGRALVAAVLAGAWLWWRRAPLPPRTAALPLAAVALGCVLGFPWLTSIAMGTLPASHGAVLVGVLPLTTAIWAALLGRERPSGGFWLIALAGAAVTVGFALREGGGSLHGADALMLLAILLGGLGYAQGGRLAQALGGQQVISWALLLAAPFALALLLVLACSGHAALPAAGAVAWLGFAYVSVFSMFIGFFFWYRGMALGGVARVGQTQLLQPFLSLAGAALLLGEPLALAQWGCVLAVIVLVAMGRKMAVRRG
ncbi:DMT family transporter [Massilia sp. S19_KUP03_FR1]|uniref:DMT family transporter n=1 Tax=Massilia sp. S19_KUP03_FR1 TaxID=3025503 RepID=UPI002FCDAEFC